MFTNQTDSGVRIGYGAGWRAMAITQRAVMEPAECKPVGLGLVFLEDISRRSRGAPRGSAHQVGGRRSTRSRLDTPPRTSHGCLTRRGGRGRGRERGRPSIRQSVGQVLEPIEQNDRFPRPLVSSVAFIPRSTTGNGNCGKVPGDIRVGVELHDIAPGTEASQATSKASRSRTTPNLSLGPNPPPEDIDSHSINSTEEDVRELLDTASKGCAGAGPRVRSGQTNRQTSAVTPREDETA